MQKEMDLVSGCKHKLVYFRLKELKDVLTQLGLSKQGKKQDLMDRILALLFDEEISSTHNSAKKNPLSKEGVAKIIEDAYRKMQVTGTTNLGTKGQSGSEINSVKPNEEVEDSSNLDFKIRCLCGSSLPTEHMVQCADPRCQVKQHICCVIVPEMPVDGVPPVAPQHYCEICRIKQADPFWVTVAHLLSPVKLIPSNISTDGTTPKQNVEKTFQLTGTHRDLLRNTEYDVQAWCILLNDSVPFRMQWPKFADLQVNGMPVRTVNRPESQLLGANGRDDGALITMYIGEGFNTISLSRCDARIFCFGIRLVKQRTLQQVLNLIPKEKDGELFEDALARVRRCIGGGCGVATANEDSDSDLEVIAEWFAVSLRCPMSGSRMNIAGRFKPCAHMGCFDLETFVKLNQRSRKWQCPRCLKNYSVEDIIIDPYFNRITNMIRHCGEDITEIDVKPDGSWRAKKEPEFEQWHFPDGSICVTTDEIILNLESSRQIKLEDNSGQNEYRHTFSSRNPLVDRFKNYGQKFITMSSAATGSVRDDEDSSINQDCSGHVEISANSGNEIDSVSHNFDPTYDTVNRCSSAPSGDADIIVLSDSDEENVELLTPEAVYKTCPGSDTGCSFSAPPGILDSFPKDPALDAGVSSCLGTYNFDGNDFGMSHWPFPSGSQAGPGFQPFGTDSDVSDALIDLEHTSANCSAAMNVYPLASNSTVNSCGQVLDSSVCHPNNVMNHSLVDNPLAFVDEDPALQNFLPTRLTGVPAKSDLGDQLPMSNGVSTENWISLRLGSSGEEGGGGFQAESGTNGLDLRNRFGSNEVSLPKGMNDDAGSKTKTNRKMSDGPFSFPRQPRSVRRRLYLSVDSDSD